MTVAEKAENNANTKICDSSKKKSTAKRKKRKISKHVLKSKEKANTDGTTINMKSSKVSKKKKGKEQKIKDPSDVNGYLTSWKNQQLKGEKGEWKFNKNTQSWLIRHMYEVDKVSKPTFGLLLEYLAGLKGDHARKRIISNATNRVLRYKKHEEQKTSSTSSNEGDGNDKNQEGSRPTSNEDDKKNTLQNNDDDYEIEDTIRWQKLDDHDKRKEYKRARKVLETLSKQ